MKIKYLIILIFLLISQISCQNQSNASNKQFLNKAEDPSDSQNKQQSSKNIKTQTTTAKKQSTIPHYQKLQTTTQFYHQFASQINKIPFSQTVNVTHLGNGKQICINSEPCQFFYYVIKPQFDPQMMNSFSLNSNDNVKNVLFVAGMHGNEYLGPLSLLYAVKHLQTPSTRIIVFPLANPSGFDHKQRLTFPTNEDPNRDFPIEQYTKCYQTTSSLVIDHIYRKYHIDLTLAVHNGKSEIGWNWGTVRQQFKSKTVDQDIYKDIGQWLKFIGGQNKLFSMSEFDIGTMNQVVYPVKGGFQDWAYAASWYNASEGIKPTRKCPFSPYPFNMTNGLVFLFQLGPFDVKQNQFGSQQGLYLNPSSRHQSNGYLSRAIRMFKDLTKILNPRLDIKLTNQNLLLKLQGCKNGIIESLKVSKKQKPHEVYYHNEQKLQLQGSINNKTIEPKVLLLTKTLFDQKIFKKTEFENLQTFELIIEYNILCDSQWQGKGKTLFGKKRQFKVKQTLLLSPNSSKFFRQSLYASLPQAISSYHYLDQQNSQLQNEDSLLEQLSDLESTTFIVIIILILVLLTVIGVVYVVVRQIRKDMKMRRIQRLEKKLQKINQQSSIDQIGPYQSSQINLCESTEAGELGNKNTTGSNKKEKKKPLQSYPQMCESDKSMKTEQLDSCRSQNSQNI